MSTSDARAEAMDPNAPLLLPIAADSPSGRALRGFQIREIEAFLAEDLSGAGLDGALIRAQPDRAADLATGILANQSKDLRVAAILTEALLRIEGFAGLRRGIDLIRELLAAFPDSVHPVVEDGDEEIRAAPIRGLAGKSFTASMERVPITKDGYTILDRMIFERLNIPTEAEARASEEKGMARRRFEEQGRVVPDEFARSLRHTGYEFFQRMAADIAGSREALHLLEEECRARFSDPAVLEDLSTQFIALARMFGQYETLCEEMRKLKAPKQPEPVAAPPAPVPAVNEPAPEAAEGVAAATVAATPDFSVPSEPATEEESAQLVFAVARLCRQWNPADPRAFLLPRSWVFGNALNRGAASSDPSPAPPTELRKELWRLHQQALWDELLVQTEQALGQPCAGGWFDLHYYSGIAMERLGAGYDVARRLTTDLLRLYLDLRPGLLDARLEDGTPAAGPLAARWLETVRSSQPADMPNAARADREQFDGDDEARPDTRPDDVFEKAAQLARSGRIGEALQLFYASEPPDDTGRGQFERKTRVAQLCMIAGHHGLALPMLREQRIWMEGRRLEEWDPEPVAAVLSMLHECLRKCGAPREEIAEVYSRLCVIDPLLSLRLGELS